MTRLTDQAHELIAAVLQPGETAIDATAGNGHDTLFLCQTVGQTGKVFALDIQQAALDQAAELLQQAGISNGELICCDHSSLGNIIPETYLERIGTIMFNLGYLPGGDHCQITKTDSTLAAIEAALLLLRPGGILTVLAYPGHPGGDSESQAVAERFSQLETSGYESEVIHARSESTSAPRLFVVKKRGRV
ncbi:class I SAM-dependent methyltransferase [uncultured Gimesia sp.]|uniref:class I SAM-dependent methyltransferase n=1 Tax=uncultured Gimesia sp. TaxID=1678688 RepID=UPI0030D9C351|tara:strand:+ start:42128 stop:42700 length:573 start_codon:yes stop_codon:yes gene_type:complete